MNAESAGPGSGSAFEVRLPRIDAPRTVAPVPPAAVATGSRAAHRRETILIVEDNTDARQALRALLELAGCTVYEARDGEAGIESALRLRPDTVLLDIGLPHLDGFEVARRLKAAQPAIRLIALTGYGREEDRARAADAGFDAYLVKPVDVEQLLAGLNQDGDVHQDVAASADKPARLP